MINLSLEMPSVDSFINFSYVSRETSTLKEVQLLRIYSEPLGTEVPRGSLQAIQLKRQEIQAKSIQQLDEKTNELLIRNAQNTATQSVNIAKMADGSSIKIETLQQTYETIKNGIKEIQQISADLTAKRNTDMQTLETIKTDMKQN